MIKHKSITVICCAVLAAALLFTCLFAADRIPFIKHADNSASSLYAETLFDRSYVHSINIEVSETDWSAMIENAQAEEYISCSVTIDGTQINNVGVRPKGNTSLTSVRSMDSERYSLKLEFDHYNDGGSYYGLDKLCLNNIIMDNTYMKDYFSYVLMEEAGAYAPLCSYVYVTLNGEDHGLFLAVEAVEESFAKRNFGSDYGEIYKPESMGMGGGGDRMEPPDTGNMPDMGEAPPNMGEAPPSQDSAADTQPGGAPDMSEAPPNTGADGGAQAADNAASARPDEAGGGRGGMGGGRGGMGGGPGGMGGSSAVALRYQGDEIESYSDIFDYAVFTPDTADKNRLISAIKQLNEGEALEEAVNIDEVLRYFAAHNFVLNFDSYTGSLMHNYYLYENDGQMSMIAWDYNLAFGAFSMGGGPGGEGGGSGETDSATEMVNFPIDTPVSGAALEDRPMLGKLLENPEYLERYHQIFGELISGYFESGEFENEFSRVYSMIAEYVQKDPTKFCTYEEFERGASTLLDFCRLRAQSIRGQLDGAIPSTSDGQTADTTAFVDASHLNIRDMGEQQMGGGRDRGAQSGTTDGSASDSVTRRFGADTGSESTAQPSEVQQQSAEQTDTQQSADSAAQPPGMRQNGQQPAAQGAEQTDAQQSADSAAQPPGMQQNGQQPAEQAAAFTRETAADGGINMPERRPAAADYTSALTILIGCTILIILGIIFALLYKKR